MDGGRVEIVKGAATVGQRDQGAPILQVGGSLEDDGGAKRIGQREEELALTDLLKVCNVGWRGIIDARIIGRH